MARLLDSIVYCYCDAENFYDEVELKRTGGVPRPCWRCKKSFRLPPRIRIERNIVMLNYDTRLFRHHVDPRHLYVGNGERQYNFFGQLGVHPVISEFR